MSNNKKKDRGHTGGQQRVRVIKPTNPDQKKGQRRVVRPSKGKGKK